MSEVLNIDRVHRNGHAELEIGIRSQGFIIKRTQDGNVSIQDSKTNSSLKIDNIYTKDEVDSKLAEKTNENGIEILNDYENNIALAPYSVAAGHATVAGISGYYYSSIDFGNEIIDDNGNSTNTFGPCTIVLCKEQGVESSEIFESGYEVDDIVSIVNNDKYVNCATIVGVDNNQIIVDALPFSNVIDVDDQDSDDYSIFVLNKPTVGTAILGYSSYTEGIETIALEVAAHAQGKRTVAGGAHSYAGGEETIALGDNSHTEGQGTVAKANSQHVQGKYNIIDNDNKYAHIVGNGTDNNNRSNAHAVDWNGNTYYAGDVYANAKFSEDGTVVGEKLTTEEYVNEQMGDINTALENTITSLENIVQIQESLISPEPIPDGNEVEY